MHEYRNGSNGDGGVGGGSGSDGGGDDGGSGGGGGGGGCVGLFLQLWFSLFYSQNNRSKRMPRQTVGESAIYGQGEIREAVVVALVVVALVVVMVSLPMILCLQIVQFWRLLKRRNLRTYGRTDRPPL